jgi:BolA protein
MIKDSLERKLREAFQPEFMEVTDESHKHQGHGGWRPEGETHFHLKAIASAFNGMSRMTRQREVYKLYADEFAAGLHALSLDLKTPEEAGR